MRSRHLRRLTIATLVAAAACSEASSSSPSAPARSDPLAPAPDPTPNAPAVSAQIVFDTTTREVAAGDSLVLLAWVAQVPSGTPLPDTVQLQTADSTLIAFERLAPSATRVTSARTGTATIELTSGQLAARAIVKVLPNTTSPSTVVVDDFHMVEYQIPGIAQWFYSPQLALHDSSVAGGSALIAVTLEIPGNPGIACATVRKVGPTPTQVYREVMGGFEGSLGTTLGRLSPTDRAVAHLTVRRPDGSAAKFTVDGPIVAGAQPGGNTPWSIIGAMACG